MTTETAVHDDLDLDMDDLTPVAEAEEDATVARNVVGDLDNLADSLKRQHQQLQGERTTMLDVPGYDGLVAQYRPVPWTVLKFIGQKVERNKGDELRELKGHAATIAAACVELFGRTQSGELVPLSKVLGLDYPVQYGPELAEFLGFKAKTATQCVLKAIAPPGSEGREYLVTTHHNELMEWMGEAKAEVDDDFMGESDTAG